MTIKVLTMYVRKLQNPQFCHVHVKLKPNVIYKKWMLFINKSVFIITDFYIKEYLYLRIWFLIWTHGKAKSSFLCEFLMGQKNATMISAQAYGLMIGHKNMAMYNLNNLPFTNINISNKTFSLSKI